MTSAGDSRLKGAAIREFLLWYERKHGARALADLVVGLEAPLAGLVRTDAPALGILASAWYPSALVHRILDRVCENRSDEGRGMARDANAEVVPRMIRGVYAMLFRAVGSPTLYALNVDRQWHRLHSTGRREVRVTSKAECFSTVSDWTGHHPMLCWVTIYTMVYVFHAMGYGHVVPERVECVSHGGTRCATVLRYW